MARCVAFIDGNTRFRSFGRPGLERHHGTAPGHPAEGRDHNREDCCTNAACGKSQH